MKAERKAKQRAHERLDHSRPSATTSAVVSRADTSATKTGNGQPDPKWTWHQQVLIKWRQRLLDQRHLLSDLAREESPQFSMSMADAATDEIDRDLLLGSASHEQDLLYEIEEALRRIEQGTYGICQATGEPIAADRLRAVPWTRFSTAAESQLEQAGSIRPVHLGTVHSVHVPSQLSFAESEITEEPVLPEPSDESLREIYSPPGSHLRTFPNPPRRRRAKASRAKKTA